MVQYSKQAIACMQAQRFFVEHSFKEKNTFLGWINSKPGSGSHSIIR